MRFSRLLLAGLCLSVSGFATTANAAGLAERVEIHGNILDGYSASGVRVWQHLATAPIQVSPKGMWEINGRELLGRDGRVLRKLRDGAPPREQLAFDQTFDTAAETWSTPALIAPGSLFFMRPVFDKSGNAWTAVATGDNPGTQLMVSDGITNTWTPVGNPISEVSFWTGSLTVDNQGDVTMACYCTLNASETNQQIQVVRYEPATGLSAIQTIYNEPYTASGFNPDNLYVTSDASGNAIVAADLAAYGAASFFYSNTTKTWSGPTQIPMPLTINPLYASVIQPALARSPNGEYIQYVYDAAVTSVDFPTLGLYNQCL